MQSDDPVVTSFLKRLESGEVDGRLNIELSKLSYAQLLALSRILAERRSSKAAEEHGGKKVRDVIAP